MKQGMQVFRAHLFHLCSVLFIFINLGCNNKLFWDTGVSVTLQKVVNMNCKHMAQNDLIGGKQTNGQQLRK